MRIVLDTNVLVSALINPGKPRKIFETTLAGKHRLVTSEPMLKELARIVSEEKVRRYITSQQAKGFERLVADVASIVDIKSRFNVLNRDDDMVLRTAYDGRARIIVTGDGHLLGLKSFRGIGILTVNDAAHSLLE